MFIYKFSTGQKIVKPSYNVKIILSYGSSAIFIIQINKNITSVIGFNYISFGEILSLLLPISSWNTSDIY